jgi:hypothetical protein
VFPPTLARPTTSAVTLAADVLARIRPAVVLVRYVRPDGDVVTATGFVVAPGVVVGTAGPGRTGSAAPARCEVVIDPGQPETCTLPAEVVKWHPSSHLLAVRVAGSDLPPPLPLDDADVKLLDPVILLGWEPPAGPTLVASAGKVTGVGTAWGRPAAVLALGFPERILSGGPAVTPDGRVLGMFTRAPPGDHATITTASQLVRALPGLLGPAPAAPVAVAPPPVSPQDRVTAATVGLQVITADNRTLTGTGLLVDADGLIVTDAAVLGGRPDRPPRSILVHLPQSGLSGVRGVAGRFVAMYQDGFRGAGLVRVDGKGLPRPAELGRAAEPRRHQEVSVLQFPYRPLTGPTAIARRATVTAVLRERDAVREFPLTGEEGVDRGGPVVDEAWQVVGFAPGGGPEPGFSFGIPAEVLRAFIRDKGTPRPVAGPAAPVGPAAPAAAPKVDGPVPVEVRLPAEVADTCVAADGRLLVLHLPKARQLAVFDLVERRVVKSLPVTEDGVLFAGGRDKLLVIHPVKKTITRYDLKTFEAEPTAPVTLPGVVRRAAMGSAGDGPLLLFQEVHRNIIRPALIDPVTLREVESRIPGRGLAWEFNSDSPYHLRAGRLPFLFAYAAQLGTGNLVLRGRLGDRHSMNGWRGHTLPGPDGRTMFTGDGFWSLTMERLDPPENRRDSSVIPAQTDGFYLSLRNVPDPRTPKRSPTPSGFVDCTVHARRDGLSLVTVKDLHVGPQFHTAKADVFTADKRVLFVPEAGRLAVVPTTNDRVLVYDIDPYREMEKARADYLVVTSLPPAPVPGRLFDYPLRVRSSAGRVTYRLDAGPPGMAVSRDGKLTWAVPADFEAPTPVTLTVADASGQEVLHTFELVPTPTPGPPSAGPFARVTLPSLADEVCVGGGGRLLIFRLPRDRRLAVLDVQAAKVVGLLPLPEDGALFAAGRDKLIVFAPRAGVFQRWDLRTLERERTALNPLRATPGVMVMGHDSAGPLVCAPGGFLDPLTLRPLDVRVVPGPADPQGFVPGVPEFPFRCDPRSTRARMSADGRLLVWNQPPGLGVLVVDGRDATAHAEFLGSTAAMSPAGVVFPGGWGFRPDRRRVFDEIEPREPGSHVGIPAVAGPAFLDLARTGDRFGLGRLGRKEWGTLDDMGLTLRVIGDDRVVLPLGWVDGLDQTDTEIALGREAFRFPDPAGAAYPPPLADRVFLVPQAKALAVLDRTCETVHFHRFDLKAVLDKAGSDYLFVADRPPSAVRGTTFRYALEVWSNKGGVALRLASGPPGMAVAGGAVTWDVPVGFAAPDAEVVLALTDSAGRESTRAFRVAVPADPWVTEVLRGLRRTSHILHGLKEQFRFLPPGELPPAWADALAPPAAPRPFEPPPVAPVPVAVTPLPEGRRVIDLPSPAGRVRVGGGGRFLILHLPKDRQLAVFDANEGRVVKLIPVGETPVFAAGMDALVVIDPDRKTAERWRLTTLEKEATAPTPGSLPVADAAMGSASAGPALVLGLGKDESETYFLDPATLRPVPGSELRVPWRSRPRYRASADGRVFTADRGTDTTIHVRTRAGWVSRQIEHRSANLPSVDGQTLFGGAGLFDREGRWAGGFLGPSPRSVWAVPATDGPFFISLTPFPDRKPRWEAAIHAGRDARPFAVLNDPADFGAAVDEDQPPRAPLDESLFFVPAAKLVAVLPKGRDRLILRRVDVRAEADRSGGDYLCVADLPPAAEAGRRYTHTPEVWSKKGGVSVRVDIGPPGMTASGGSVTWDVPADYRAGEVEVVLAVSDASGREALYPLRLTVRVPAGP